MHNALRSAVRCMDVGKCGVVWVREIITGNMWSGATIGDGLCLYTSGHVYIRVWNAKNNNGKRRKLNVERFHISELDKLNNIMDEDWVRVIGFVMYFTFKVYTVMEHSALDFCILPISAM